MLAEVPVQEEEEPAVTEEKKRKRESDDEDDDGIITKEGVESLGVNREKSLDRLKVEKLNRLAGANFGAVAFKKRKTNQAMKRQTPTSTRID